jgi:hypothetical protein
VSSQNEIQPYVTVLAGVLSEMPAVPLIEEDPIFLDLTTDFVKESVKSLNNGDNQLK